MVTKARGGDTVNGVALGQLLLRREGMELDLAEASAENPDGTLVIKCRVFSTHPLNTSTFHSHPVFRTGAQRWEAN